MTAVRSKQLAIGAMTAVRSNQLAVGAMTAVRSKQLAVGAMLPHFHLPYPVLMQPNTHTIGKQIML
jgi:uncharacterized Ntn-hydrolase superfamily protein